MIPDEITNGKARPQPFFIAKWLAIAPTAGPIVNPSPKLMPITAIPLLRVFASVTSATYADAVAIVPAHNPATNRTAYSSVKPVTCEVHRSAAIAPRIVTIKTGLLPHLSERYPHNGAIIN